MTSKPLTLPVLANMASLALLWGGSFLAIRTALDDVPVATSVAHRVFWAALILWAIVAVRRDPVPTNLRIWAAFLIMGLLNNAIPFTLMAWGQLYVETGLTAILNATTALWGVLVAALVFPDERLTLRRGIGVTLGLGGVVIAIGPGTLAGIDPRALAQLAVLGGTLSYAFAGSWARARLGNVPPLVAAAGMLAGSSFVMLPLAWWLDGPPDLAMAPRTWIAIAYYAAAATALAYIFYYRILAAAGAGNLLLVTLLIPPIAICLGAVVRGERLVSTAYFGFAVLGVGLLVLDGRLGHAIRKRMGR